MQGAILMGEWPMQWGNYQAVLNAKKKWNVPTENNGMVTVKRVYLKNALPVQFYFKINRSQEKMYTMLHPMWNVCTYLNVNY